MCGNRSNNCEKKKLKVNALFFGLLTSSVPQALSALDIFCFRFNYVGSLLCNGVVTCYEMTCYDRSLDGSTGAHFTCYRLIMDKKTILSFKCRDHLVRKLEKRKEMWVTVCSG